MGDFRRDSSRVCEDVVDAETTMPLSLETEAAGSAEIESQVAR